MTQQCCVYRFFDVADQLLYVGMSKNPFKRLSAHQRGGKDMQQVARVDMSWFANADAAHKAERKAIRRENPLWNLTLYAIRKVPTSRPVKARRLPASPRSKRLDVPYSHPDFDWEAYKAESRKFVAAYVQSNGIDKQETNRLLGECHGR